MRQALHALAAVCAALAGGTVVFAGLDSAVTKDIASLAGLIGLALNTYLGSTSTTGKETP